MAELLKDGFRDPAAHLEAPGVQRARLGWAEDSVRREFVILREEIVAAVRRKVSSRGADRDEAVGILLRFLVHAERISLRGWRRSMPVEAS